MQEEPASQIQEELEQSQNLVREKFDQLFQHFGLHKIKTSSILRKGWAAPPQWHAGLKLKNITLGQINRTNLVQVDIVFQDENSYQRRKRIFFNFRPSYLKNLQLSQIRLILQKIQPKTIFSQTFWQLWFGLMNLTPKGALCHLKQILHLESTIIELAEYSAIVLSGKEATGAEQQNQQISNKLVATFSIAQISLAADGTRRCWSTPRHWKGQYQLVDMGQILYAGKSSSVRIHFVDKNQIPRSRNIIFSTDSQLINEKTLSEILQRNGKAKSRDVFSPLFWELWVAINISQKQKTRSLLKLGLRLELSPRDKELLGIWVNQPEESLSEQNSSAPEMSPNLQELRSEFRLKK